MEIKDKIKNGKTALGIELGSTRIKAVLIDENHSVLAFGEYVWENKFIGGIWTYGEDDIKSGVQECYRFLKNNVKKEYGVTLKNVGVIGISAMMHGYMVFDKCGRLLTPFRTWRNNNAEFAAKELTNIFNYPVPARWSIAHLYQAVLDNEPHVKDIAFQTTLEGYVHNILTGEKVIGIGEGSGMFPIDLELKNYNPKMTEIFDAILNQRGVPFTLKDIFPKVLKAGQIAGFLTKAGALFLDPDGDLMSGIPFCPPEGDAGTGMVATDAVKKGTGNISAGTSIFGMVVLEKELSKVYSEIDLVTTPAGDLVAMAHCNNCSSEINAWVNIFEQLEQLLGNHIDRNTLYTKLFESALEGDADCGGLLVYNYLSSEYITAIDEGRPMFLRTTESKFTLANFMRAQIYSAFAALKIGLDILFKKENAKIHSINAHGGIFKTASVAQKFLASALGVPVTVNKTANEGGAWGMSVLAMYMKNGGKLRLEEYLSDIVFAKQICVKFEPDEKTTEGFESFISEYIKGLPAVKEAVTALKK